MKRRIFLFTAFACVGITTEIFFTAITDNIDFYSGSGIDWKLQGKSYIWMFPIYGLAGLAFPLLVPRIRKVPLIGRAAVYATGILAVEYITGWLLYQTTGSCPWEYTSGWHIHGFIRLDYFPLWAIFGVMLESLTKVLEKVRL